MEIPHDAALYGWSHFTLWAEPNGVSLEDEGDYGPWWNCWKAAYILGLNVGTVIGGHND